MIAQFTHYLPGREVSKGDQWTTTQQLTSGGMMLDIVTTYRFDSLEGERAGITAESAISLPNQPLRHQTMQRLLNQEEQR